jgi:hypothetical protein
MTDNSKEALLASMRRTLTMMECMGVPRALLAEVLELAAREVRQELKRQRAARKTPPAKGPKPTAE